jgi:2-methylcitrate dehydratase PrpD
VIRSIRDGFTAKAGVLSALLAKKGLKGVKHPLEGQAGFFNLHFRGEYERELLVKEYGKRYEGAYVRFKPYPGCWMNHGFIEAILDLSRENDIQPNDVQEVVLRVTNTTKAFCEPLEERRKPPSAIDAKVALPFTAALALSRRQVTLAEYLPEVLKDDDVLALSSRVNYRVEENFGHRNLEPAGVIINCKNGKKYDKYVEFSYGHPSNPITKEDLISKFRDCCGYSVKKISREDQDRIIEMVLHLEEVPDVGEIIALLG